SWSINQPARSPRRSVKNVVRNSSLAMPSEPLIRSPRWRWHRHFEAEFLRCLEVDDQLELGRLPDRKITRPLALENPASIASGLAIGRHLVLRLTTLSKLVGASPAGWPQKPAKIFSGLPARPKTNSGEGLS